MLRLVVPLLTLITYGLAADITECSWGESHWCSSLENAKACGAFDHCISTVWKNQILKADDSELCDFCKLVIDDVTKFVKDNRTQQDILRFVKNACRVIPFKGLADECSLLAENFLTEIVTMIASAVNPRNICGLLKLCKGFENTIVRPRLPSSPAIEQSRPLTKLSPLTAGSEPICTDCKKFFTDIKNWTTSGATEQEVEQLIDQALCAHLGTYEEMCKDLIKVYLPKIMTFLGSEFDPNVACQSFGFCTATLKEAKTFLINLKLKISEFYKTISAQNSAEGCLICTTVMKELQDLDRNKAVQEKIKEFFKTEICAHLGTLKTTCDQFIDDYSETVFELLANELDPESRCRSLGFCSTKIGILDHTREATPVKVLESGRHVAVSPECILCEYVLEKVEDMLKANATKQDIIVALDKVCSILPSTVRASCEDFVNRYGSAVIDLLVQEIDPKLVCTTLGLCSSKQRVMPSTVNESTKCIVCETIVQYLEALLEDNSTIAEMEKLLEKICNFLPEKYREECDYIISQYASYIIQYLSTAMTPKGICESIGLCDTKLIRSIEMAELTEAEVIKSSHPLLGEIECSWGPKFWCSSRENAVTCKAVDYCEQTGWN